MIILTVLIQCFPCKAEWSEEGDLISISLESCIRKIRRTPGNRLLVYGYDKGMDAKSACIPFFMLRVRKKRYEGGWTQTGKEWAEYEER